MFRMWAMALASLVSTIPIYLVVTAVSASPASERGRSVVASDHVLASRAGRQLLQEGGNAADAAVAAALAAGVVQPAGSGLGGGGFAVGSDASGSWVLDFREVAPMASTRDMYVGDAGVDSKASRRGGMAVAVPGESRGLAWLLANHGSRSAGQVAGPAIRLAGRGWTVGDHLGKALGRTDYTDVIDLFSVGGVRAARGGRVRNPALASTLRRWVRSAGEDLHTGVGAAEIVRVAGASNGILVARDLADWRPKERKPIECTFRGQTLVTMPPPSSGGVVLCQVLRVIEDHPLHELGHNSSEYVHLLVEAMKHAYADRAHHLGDPDFVDVPVNRLISDERRDEVRRKIYPTRTFGVEHYGPKIAPPQDGGTQHISVVDQHGTAVALTTTINTSFGSGLTAGGLILNNEMDDFSAAPGTPNAFGLVGSEANAIVAGKRPLSSMTPTVVLDDQGQVAMSIGASGGSTIISSTLQVYLNVVVFEMEPQAAVAAPRFHHQWLPDRLFIEPDFPLDVQRSLSARGHTLDVRPAFSAVQIVVRSDGEVSGGADPRKGGWPAAVP
ncbi:MAG: gamma-glutamyltranspeptidase/glutathione hydrolase [Kiritimatiellia bacterium]|jgi:gamma-glutamyltranspeptidase/glutathione hydrolase